MPSSRHLGRRKLLLLVAASLLAAWLSPGEAPPAAAAGRATLTVGNHVPGLSFTGLDGRSRTVSWTGGEKTTIFFFFEFRSSPGLFGLTYLDNLYGKAGDFGLEVIAVEAGGHHPDGIREDLEKYKTLYPEPSFTIVPDPDGSLRDAFGVSEAPVLFIVESHGVVFFTERGFDAGTGDRLSARIGKALRLPAGILPESSPEPPSGEGGSAEPRERILFPGDRVPPLSVTDIKGGKHTLDWSSQGGRMAVIFFWTDPCRPCIEEMLFLDQLAGRARDLGLALDIWSVADNRLDGPAAASVMEKYTRVYPYPVFPIILDAQARLSEIFGPGEAPATFLVDGEGTVLSYAREFNGMVVGEWIGLIEGELPRAQGALLPLLE